jgi:glutamate--cysteine ligase
MQPTQQSPLAPPSDPSSPASSPAPESPVTRVDELVAHFARGCKQSALKVGLEHEKIGVALDEDGTVRPLPYDDQPGRPQIRELLRGLTAHGWQPVEEQGNVIALRRSGASVTLEPGGQFELSGRPFVSEVDGVRELDEHLGELLPMARDSGVAFLGCGFRPLGTWDDVLWMPKGRYRIMRAYLPTRGQLGVEMMKRTATVQANLDYVSEADAIEKMRLGLGLGPLVTALYAASPLVDGKPTDWKSFRAHCWLDTDNDRCGFLPFMFDENAGFRAYAEWALDVPMFFVYRHGTYTAAGGMTFRQYMREGFHGEHATLADWELHLSTLFPDARLKQYVELRTADAGPLDLVRGLGALWRGLFYSEASRRAAWALVSDLSIAERDQLRRDVTKQAMHARVRGRDIGPLVEEMVSLAAAGLRALGSEDGARLLDPLLERARSRRCPADDILAAFNEVGGDPRAFVERVRIDGPAAHLTGRAAGART